MRFSLMRPTLTLLALSTIVIGCGGGGGQKKTYNNDLSLVGAKLPSKQAIADAPQPLLFGSTGSSGSSVDLSTSLALPPVGDQSPLNSCVSWALGYGLTSYEVAIANSTDSSVPSRQVSPADLYAKTLTSEGLSPCTNVGTYFDYAINALEVKGAASMSQVPYTGGCIAPSSYSTFRLNGHHAVQASDSTTIKTLLSQGHPIAIAAETYNNFQDWLRTHHDDSVFNGAGGFVSQGGHAMLVVGYDDSRQAYKIMNSWGQGYGNGGFFWMSYSTFANSVHGGYVADNGATNTITNPTSGSLAFVSSQAVQYNSVSTGVTYLVMPFSLNGPMYVQSWRMRYTGDGTTTPWQSVNQWVTSSYVWWGLPPYFNGYTYVYSNWPSGSYTLEFTGQDTNGAAVSVSTTASLQYGGYMRDKRASSVEASPTVLAPLMKVKRSVPTKTLAPGMQILMNGHLVTLER